MKKTQIESSETQIRQSKLDILSVIKMNRALSFAISGILIIAMGVFSFSFAFLNSEPEQAYAKTAETDSTINSWISERDLLCLEIENLDQESENKILQEENEIIKEESDSIEDKILDALMANLQDKELTNRSATLNNYISEARNLLDLNWKLVKFRQTEDYDLIDLSEYENALTSRLSHIPTLKPIPGSFPGYGWRIHPIYGYKQFHAAADQGAPRGTPVKAAASGYVVRSTYDSRSGYYIVINHGNGFVTKYLHHSVNLVKAGVYVKQGEVIAKVGNTGTSTNPHLHFEVLFNGSPLDPRKILMQ